MKQPGWYGTRSKIQRVERPYRGTPPTNGTFKVTRVRTDQVSTREGCTLFLQFSLTGPAGLHSVRTRLTSDSVTPPQIKHDSHISLDDGATGQLRVTLDFPCLNADPCRLSIGVNNKVIGRFLVEPSPPRELHLTEQRRGYRPQRPNDTPDAS